MGDANLKKNGSVLLNLNMSGLDSLILCLVGVLHLKIQIHHSLQKKSLFFYRLRIHITLCLLLSLLSEIFSKQYNYRTIITMYSMLRNIFLDLLCRKKFSHSAGKMHSYEKIFPRLTEILVSYRRDLGQAVKLSAHMNRTFLLVKISIMAGSR